MHRRQLIQQWLQEILDLPHKMSNPSYFSIHECYRNIVHVSMPYRKHGEILSFVLSERTFCAIFFKRSSSVCLSHSMCVCFSLPLSLSVCVDLSHWLVFWLLFFFLLFCCWFVNTVLLREIDFFSWTFNNTHSRLFPQKFTNPFFFFAHTHTHTHYKLSEK